MQRRLDRKKWINAVNKRRGDQVPGKTFAVQVKQAKATRPKSLSSIAWTDRIALARTGGPHLRAIGHPSSQRKGRPVGGMLRSNTPQKRKEISENQRQALPKTGDRVPKKGINASNWAYDHRKTVAARRNKAIEARKTGPKKGINAEKWHYDHTKAKQAKTANSKGPSTHVSSEKKRTQKEAIAKYQPKQPARPKQPPAQMKPKAPVRARGR